MFATINIMASSRLPAAALTLKQFLQRQKVLSLYRNMLRTIRQVPDEGDRKYLRDWARDEFKRNKNSTNQDAIRMMITQANMHHDELQSSLALANVKK
uniref:LYR motif-containing protein 2 n=1 Tax=Hucho hucho TaxID=62062 RepID=A0A4W5NHM8_9TELE